LGLLLRDESGSGCVPQEMRLQRRDLKRPRWSGINTHCDRTMALAAPTINEISL
jgi:hypothetical protein